MARRSYNNVSKKKEDCLLHVFNLVVYVLRLQSGLLICSPPHFLCFLSPAPGNASCDVSHIIQHDVSNIIKLFYVLLKNSGPLTFFQEYLHTDIICYQQV